MLRIGPQTLSTVHSKKVKFTAYKLYLNKSPKLFNSLKNLYGIHPKYKTPTLWISLLSSFSLPIWKRHHHEFLQESASSSLIQSPSGARPHSSLLPDSATVPETVCAVMPNLPGICRFSQGKYQQATNKWDPLRGPPWGEIRSGPWRQIHTVSVLDSLCDR